MKKRKSEFNIERIGRFRFYCGIVLGPIFGLVLNQFFLKLIQLSDVISELLKANWENPFGKNPDFFYSFFWSLFSVSLGFCFTIYLWTSKPLLNNRRETRMNRIAQANSLFIFGVIFLSVFRLLQLYFGFHYLGNEIKEEFGVLIFMVPIFIYSYNWVFISRIYKSTKPFLISFIIFVVYGLILSGIKTWGNTSINAKH